MAMSVFPRTVKVTSVARRSVGVYACTCTQGIHADGGGTMNPLCVPFGTTSRHLPRRGSLTTARHVYRPVRASLISKSSCGMRAFASTESPVTFRRRVPVLSGGNRDQADPIISGNHVARSDVHRERLVDSRRPVTGAY